ncbi:D-methionine transport system ATP-binding protein [Pararhizobium capsulatum DSM 1112]|uniref:D-methionine transport system ATP-binding protein n=1 Tax=Pararhizobium capsulatum DSM 1112 TaxID=1121113 RepID=A0ABU0BUR8_9HYPH|nr:methionine ABC transporter ATP-binding protein [Pararhizobium capsulatum]MDQ0322006.1 D-methionine transport system ATP-binding protein [Pararhizobium capsulatum DSM 1112]
MTKLALSPVLRIDEKVEPSVTAAPARRQVVRVEDLTMVYDQKAGPVLDKVSLSVEEGDIHGIIGRSGAGKSTLVRCLNRLVVPTSGRIEVSGHDITRLSGADLRGARRDIGMIFQHFSLMSSRTAADNVALPLEIAGISKEEIRKRIPVLLDLVGLSNKADAYPVELSGGQKQRVGIARALALDPKVLLSDEATSALDPETTEQILSLLKDINRRLGLTIVLITHEMEVVRAIASHVTVLEHGQVVESGPTFDVFAFPKSPVARSFLSSIVAHELPPQVAGRLSPEPSSDTAPVLRIVFTGEAAEEPVVADLAVKFGIRASILHGRIDYIDERPLGILTLLLPEAADRVPAILAHLSSLGLHGEVIGHAVRSSAAGTRRAAS